MITDPIMKVKDYQDLVKFNDTEADYEEYNRLIRQVGEVAKIKLAHKFGVGDCPCSLCNY